MGISHVAREKRFGLGIQINNVEPDPQEDQEYVFADEKRAIKFAAKDQAGNGGYRDDSCDRKIVHVVESEAMWIEVGDPRPHENSKERLKEADRKRGTNHDEEQEVTHGVLARGSPPV